MHIKRKDNDLIFLKKVDDYKDKEIVEEFCNLLFKNKQYKIIGGMPRNLYYDIKDYKDVDILVNKNDFEYFKKKYIELVKLDDLCIISTDNNIIEIKFKNLNFQLLNILDFKKTKKVSVDLFLKNKKDKENFIAFDFNVNEIFLVKDNLYTYKKNVMNIKNKKIKQNDIRGSKLIKFIYLHIILNQEIDEYFYKDINLNDYYIEKCKLIEIEKNNHENFKLIMDFLKEFSKKIDVQKIQDFKEKKQATRIKKFYLEFAHEYEKSDIEYLRNEYVIDSYMDICVDIMLDSLTELGMID